MEKWLKTIRLTQRTCGVLVGSDVVKYKTALIELLQELLKMFRNFKQKKQTIKLIIEIYGNQLLFFWCVPRRQENIVEAQPGGKLANFQFQLKSLLRFMQQRLH